MPPLAVMLRPGTMHKKKDIVMFDERTPIEVKIYVLASMAIAMPLVVFMFMIL
jgi:hypothetical protein